MADGHRGLLGLPSNCNCTGSTKDLAGTIGPHDCRPYTTGASDGLTDLLKQASKWDGFTAFAALDLVLDIRDWEPPWCGGAQPLAPHRAVRDNEHSASVHAVHASQHCDAQVLAVEAWLASRTPCQTLLARCARQLAVGLLPRALEQLVRFRHANRAVRFVTRPLDAFELSEAELTALAPAELAGLCKQKGIEQWRCKEDAIEQLLCARGAQLLRARGSTVCCLAGAPMEGGHRCHGEGAQRACDSAGPAAHACNRARLGFCCGQPEAWVGSELGRPLGAPANELVHVVRPYGL